MSHLLSHCSHVDRHQFSLDLKYQELAPTSTMVGLRLQRGTKGVQPGTKQGQPGTRQGQPGTKQGQAGTKQGQLGTKQGQENKWTNSITLERHIWTTLLDITVEHHFWLSLFDVTD